MAKIMLCDDSKTMLLIFEKKLKDAGHEIVGKAADGEEGIKLYNEKRPELTLLDITMPNKDGREALQGILKINTAAKVIMVSALKEEEVINECLKNGAKAFISKNEVIKDEDFKREVLSVIEKVLKTA
jgi:two-component system chemotaxis response regulator CheY